MIISSSTSMEAQEEEAKQSSHSCDYCDSSVALLYCKADSAKLCLACDKEVHSTNQLFAKHFRSLLCDSCNDSPASVFCDTKRSLLCQNCDWERHTSSSRCGGATGSSSVHSRRPVEGFSGCPSVTELLAILGLDDLSDKSLFLNDGERFTGSGGVGGSSELLLWETPDIVCLNDLIASGGSGHNFRAMDIPPLPKNRHATCGKHKDEMIRQLRELSRSEPSCLKYETLEKDDDHNGFQFLAPDNNLFQTCEVSGMKWYEESAEEHQEDEDFPYYSLLTNLTESDKKPCAVVASENVKRFLPEESSLIKRNRCEEETLMVPVCSTTTKSTTIHEINSVERNSALSRYKEKKKSRRYEKHIRYESRKVRAESRTRIRGRFAKADP